MVSLQANSAKLVSELAKSKKNVNSWAKDIRAKVNSLATAFAASALATGATIVAIVNGHSEEIDRLAKKAGSLRIDTSGLQRLRYQAGLSGVSTESLDKSMTKMLKTVSDGKAGLSTAVRALDDLGLSAERLSQMNSDDQFYAIAEAMNGVQSQADKTRIAMDIFGRSGSDLLNMFASDLKATGAEFDSLGASMTSQQAAMVEAYVDAKAKLSTIWDGFLNQMTIRLAPLMKDFANYISQIAIEFGGLDKVAASVVSGIATGVGFVADVFYGWQLVIKGVRIVILKLAETAAKAFKFIYSQYYDLIKLINKDALPPDFFGGMSDSFSKEADKIKKEFDDLLAKDRPSIAIDSAVAKMQSEVVKAGKDNRVKNVTASNTEASKQNTAATDALTAAIKTPSKTAASGFSSSAWEKVFGKQDDVANKNLKVSQIFSDYARSLNAAINRQDTNSMAYFVEQTQRTIDGLAGRGPNGLNFGSDRSYDIDGMQSVLDRLIQKMNDTPETVGSIDINVAADGKTISGKLMGDPAFLKQLKQFVDNSTKETARAVAR
ncbi:hypothetical protein [uncultured Amphritea sp.]|uniref:hypothetical protein n=1 Tax=uncultured Amphritea sp. TaxID=981605 RepID=UPI002632414F|nr:hypothetical protein [uncultured Amphritea sp.]